jgi:hypothetical protein
LVGEISVTHVTPAETKAFVVVRVAQRLTTTILVLPVPAIERRMSDQERLRIFEKSLIYGSRGQSADGHALKVKTKLWIGMPPHWAGRDFY